MPIISKKPNFFRENYFGLFGSVWALFGGAIVIVDESMPLGYLYLFMSVGYFLMGYIKRHQNKAYIKWDDEKLIFSDWYQRPVAYPYSSIDAIIISGENLTIKSGAANGTMIDLKGYDQEDIHLLKSVSINHLDQLN